MAEREKADDGKPISDEDRAVLDIALQTVSTLKGLFSSRGTFVIIAGAVFALHQDTLRAYGIDMNRTEVSWGLVMDYVQPHVLGDFPTRCDLVMNAMLGIDKMNLKLITESRPTPVDERDPRQNPLMGRARSIASHAWLITMISKTRDDPVLKLCVINMWAMLRTVPRKELSESAGFFTGTYFEGVRSEPMNFKHWPQDE